MWDDLDGTILNKNKNEQKKAKYLSHTIMTFSNNITLVKLSKTNVRAYQRSTERMEKKKKNSKIEKKSSLHIISYTLFHNHHTPKKYYNSFYIYIYFFL